MFTFHSYFHSFFTLVHRYYIIFHSYYSPFWPSNFSKSISLKKFQIHFRMHKKGHLLKLVFFERLFTRKRVEVVVVVGRVCVVYVCGAVVVLMVVVMLLVECELLLLLLLLLLLAQIQLMA